MELLYSCFILLWKRHKCISSSTELGREPGTNDYQSHALAIALSPMIPNGSLSFSTT